MGYATGLFCFFTRGVVGSGVLTGVGCLRRAASCRCTTLLRCFPMSEQVPGSSTNLSACSGSSLWSRAAKNRCRKVIFGRWNPAALRAQGNPRVRRPPMIVDFIHRDELKLVWHPMASTMHGRLDFLHTLGSISSRRRDRIAGMARATAGTAPLTPLRGGPFLPVCFDSPLSPCACAIRHTTQCDGCHIRTRKFYEFLQPASLSLGKRVLTKPAGLAVDLQPCVV